MQCSSKLTCGACSESTMRRCSLSLGQCSFRLPHSAYSWQVDGLCACQFAVHTRRRRTACPLGKRSLGSNDASGRPDVSRCTAYRIRGGENAATCVQGIDKRRPIGEVVATREVDAGQILIFLENACSAVALPEDNGTCFRRVSRTRRS